MLSLFNEYNIREVASYGSLNKFRVSAINKLSSKCIYADYTQNDAIIMQHLQKGVNKIEGLHRKLLWRQLNKCSEKICSLFLTCIQTILNGLDELQTQCLNVVP